MRILELGEEIKCKSAGANVVKHFKDLAFMGFYEVLINIRTILKNISFCKKDILEFSPDKIIFIDYPGFNMRIAKWSKKYKFRNHILHSSSTLGME